MKEKTRQRIIFACLGLAILWAVANFDSTKKTVSEQDNKTIKPLSASAITTTTESLIDVEACERANWGMDPFRHYAKKKRNISPVAVSWTLSGIVYSSENPMAVINNKTVRVGDRIDKARVIRIDKNRVTIEHEGSPVTLTVTKG